MENPFLESAYSNTSKFSIQAQDKKAKARSHNHSLQGNRLRFEKNADHE